MNNSFFNKRIRSWINGIVSTSDYLKADVVSRKEQESRCILNPDYSFGWKDAIEMMMESGKTDGLLLTGPDGCGKHTAADIAVNILAGEDYRILYLSGKDFMFTEEEINANEENHQQMIEQEEYDILTDDIVHTFLDKLLDEFFESGANICFVTEGIMQSDFGESVYQRLGKYMCMYNSSPDFPRMVSLLIEPDDACVPSMLRKYLRLIRVSYPNKEQRRRVLINCGVKGDAAQASAEYTEGFTYAQLSDLARNIAVYSELNEDGQLNADFYLDIIDSQSPDTLAHTNAKEGSEAFYSEKIRLYQKLQQLVDIAPQILEKMGQPAYIAAPVMQQAANIQQSPQQQTAPQAQQSAPEKQESLADLQQQQAQLKVQSENRSSEITEESKTMTIGNLFDDVFGEERKNAMFSSAPPQKVRERN